MTEQSNHLINEKSPYLLQHAHNPVMWYPWGDKAFKVAKEQDKLIFLSIGYSTCHWCHVMERESFEDAEVADAMNRVFVSIKVDREERPDLDNFYMNVCQMLTGSGGWPLNLVLTPERKPIFAFTYLPKRSRRNLMGIIEVCSSVEKLWSERKSELLEQGSKIVDGVTRSGENPYTGGITADLIKRGYESLVGSFDEKNGGFGYAPKFPSPHYLLFLLRYNYRHDSSEHIRMVTKTLDGILDGGIHDQVGFGFHRYSTDSEWKLPHFEKMLYDQAMLMAAFGDAYAVTRKKEYLSATQRTLAFLRNEMQDTSGGFYTALDADSEGEEGRFYTWSYQELSSLLGEDTNMFSYAFGCSQEGNFHDESTGRLTGRNILYRETSNQEVAAEFNTSEKEAVSRLDKCINTLKAARDIRIRPHRDDKVLSDLNGLLLWSLAKVYRNTMDDQFLDASKGIAAFLTDRMIDGDGKMKHRYKDGSTGIPGLLDDYAFCIAGFLELYQVSSDETYLKTALSLQKYLDKHFKSEDGGYYNTELKDVPARLQNFHDGAIPSGNSFASESLVKLGLIFGNSEYLDAPYDIAAAAGRNLQSNPFYFLHLLSALDLAIGPSYDVVIPASLKDKRSVIFANYNPNTVVSFQGNARPDVAGAFAKNKDGILICSLKECYPPVKDIEEALEIIGKKKRSG